MKLLILPKMHLYLACGKVDRKTTAHFPTSPATITSADVSHKRGHLYFGEKGTFLLWVDIKTTNGSIQKL
jgi:hypothetical protein